MLTCLTPLYNTKGKRKDLDLIADLLNAGNTSWEQIYLAVGSGAIRYVSHITKVLGLLDKPKVRTNGLQVALLYGETNTGKSHTAWGPWVDGENVSPDVYRVCHPSWMDGYESQSTLIIDDVDFLDWPIGSVLQVLDKWPVQRQRKGSSVWAKWNRVLVCHNSYFREWQFKGAKPAQGTTGCTHSQMEALDRRFSVIIRFTGTCFADRRLYVERGSLSLLGPPYDSSDSGSDQE